jgi:hypothetical protein
MGSRGPSPLVSGGVAVQVGGSAPAGYVVAAVSEQVVRGRASGPQKERTHRTDLMQYLCLYFMVRI